jgi:16S rRNA (guanine1516-N2)-methyltransferase
MSQVCAVLSVQDAPQGEGLALAHLFSVPHLEAGHLPLAQSREIRRFLREQGLTGADRPIYIFIVSGHPLSLLQLASDSSLRLSADLADPSLNYRRLKGGGRQQMLAKAVGLSASAQLQVLDATAGLGRDAFILASLGARVRMVERVPEVRTLLESALSRAREQGPSPDFLRTIQRLSLEPKDAITYMGALDKEFQPDVVYLDPMFPSRKKSALVKKEMRILHDLVGLDADRTELFEAAWQVGAPRIVVKRPRIAPALTDIKPNHVFSGKRNRFDVYLRNAAQKNR